MENKISLTLKLRKAFILSAIFFVIISSGCKKDGDFVPEFDNASVSVFFTDTFSLVTGIELEDSIVTNLAAFNLLGIYNDPVFGPTSSSFYSQVTLNGLDVDFGANPIIDSIVLTLAYVDLYGDSATPMTVNVFELTEPLTLGTNYFSDQSLSSSSTPIATKTFVPNIADSVFLPFEATTVAPHLRIRLDDAFGQSILDASSTDLASSTSFDSFLNGLYLTTSETVDNTSLAPEDGSIIYFNVNSPISTVTIYYNNTLSYNFTMNTGSVKFNTFDHNYTNTDIDDQLNGAGNTDLAYVQTLAGLKTKIEIPNIKNLIQDGPVIINKAELVITLDEDSDMDFEAIQQLILVGIDENGNSVFLQDLLEEGADFFGGAINDGTYTFNISRHVHNLLYDTSVDFGMYLVSTSSSISANRSIIGTETNPIVPMKLNITYSKL